MKQAILVIDTFPGKRFAGFSKGENWNGRACPYFTYEEGRKIVEAHNSERIKA